MTLTVTSIYTYLLSYLINKSSRKLRQKAEFIFEKVGHLTTNQGWERNMSLLDRAHHCFYFGRVLAVLAHVFVSSYYSGMRNPTCNLHNTTLQLM